jgi:hypothetical protein
VRLPFALPIQVLTYEGSIAWAAATCPTPGRLIVPARTEFDGSGAVRVNCRNYQRCSSRSVVLASIWLGRLRALRRLRMGRHSDTPDFWRFASQSGPPRLEAGYGDPEGRAGNVVEPDVVEKVDRLRVSAMLAAHPQLKVGPGPAALLGGRTNQAPYPLDIQGSRRGRR